MNQSTEPAVGKTLGRFGPQDRQGGRRRLVGALTGERPLVVPHTGNCHARRRIALFELLVPGELPRWVLREIAQA